MKTPSVTTFFVALALAASSAFVAVDAQQAKETKDAKKAAPLDMAEIKKRAERYTKPGKHHQALERFIGKWSTETRVFMGGQVSPPEKGTTEFAWLMEGRWLKGEWEGTLMSIPLQGFLLMGYDNFKQSYVTTQITSMDTAMTHAEGDMDPEGKALLSYGTLDEYLTGEHDKMVKYAWRFLAKDKMVLEVHDLPIGEKNTKVIEVTYARAP